jgi:hypothetical protein
METEGRKKKALSWDEENLDYNEENKTPKMKIDEPPTPFNFDYCDDEAGDGTWVTPKWLARERGAGQQRRERAAARWRGGEGARYGTRGSVHGHRAGHGVERDVGHTLPCLASRNRCMSFRGATRPEHEFPSRPSCVSVS